jgi:YesN/AraC family two-component response regulator
MENVVPDIGELNLIKKLEPETKVIVYSGWDENGYAQKYINAGAHIFIKTPLTLPELLDTLKKVLK